MTTDKNNFLEEYEAEKKRYTDAYQEFEAAMEEIEGEFDVLSREISERIEQELMTDIRNKISDE